MPQSSCFYPPRFLRCFSSEPSCLFVGLVLIRLVLSVGTGGVSDRRPSLVCVLLKLACLLSCVALRGG